MSFPPRSRPVAVLHGDMHGAAPAVLDTDLVRGDEMTSEPIALAALGDDDTGVLSWQEQALCAQTDPEAFFPEKGGSTREAKRICVGCDVKGECLEYALGQDERFGIWGGLSERERRRLKRAAG
jgi:WhiB family redox-sensing transcriptional regulator